VVNDRIFVCAEPATLVCVSLNSGEILWQKANPDTDILPPEEVRKAEEVSQRIAELRKQQQPFRKQLWPLKKKRKESPDDETLKAKIDELTAQVQEFDKEIRKLVPLGRPPTHKVNGYSSATPASDGKYVYAVFGSGIAVCCDLNGARKWAKLVEKPTQQFGHSSSPLLVGGKLIVCVQKMWALDPGSGDVLWQTPIGFKWGSPVSARVGDVDVAVTATGDVVRVADGKMLVKGIRPLTYCSPVVHEGVAYFIENPGKAAKLPGAADAPTRPEVLWQTQPKKERYYASPLCHEGLIYAVTRYGDFSVIDAANGKVVCERKLDLGKGEFYASVTLAGGRIYVSSDNGTTLVLEPGREYKEIARNTLEPFRGSPVFLGKRMIVRGQKHLYCIGK